MRLLSFLVEREAVGTQDLAEALVAQRRSRPPLGAVAQEAGDMSRDEVESVLLYQRLDRSRRFGEIALDLGYLSNHQLDRNLRIQRSRERSLLQVLIDMSVLPRDRAGELASLYTQFASDTEVRDIELSGEITL